MIEELGKDLKIEAVPAKDVSETVVIPKHHTVKITEPPIDVQDTLQTSVTSMNVSTDRSIYPLDSIIHVSARIPSLIQGEKIFYRVFDSDQNLLLSQEIDPVTHDQHPELKCKGVYQASFRMQGNKWKINKEYMVTVTHDSISAKNFFSIEQTMPVLQSDKSVYMIGSDMIITVIDPDADKDNEVAEYAGDTKNSKLVIKSSHGKINGYRLKETGKSTGIFQGIIGILGIRKDDSVIPRKIDGKIIDKIQGTGINDGFIGGAPGEELTIVYTNNTGTTRMPFFISNFGAAVEMDKQTYKANDRVFLTVVAPDLNFDSDAINEMGDSIESFVEIKTSIDMIKGFKLIETEKDSGIFAGELQLEKIIKPTQSIVHTKSDGRTLKCADDDFIDVTLTLFEDKRYHCMTSIKS